MFKVMSRTVNRSRIDRNSQYECVVRMPFAIEHMVREKIIIKHQVPTEKVFTVSPLKSSKLPMKRNVENTLFSPCSMPVEKEEYNKRFDPKSPAENAI
ncbi:unnamed protein product [Pieris macdunnoughi]|uniref:Uncharacterized protein n=1 Tax=Pieris macdunnoughi TaxID=345717 RepID=A0A821XSK7_9NEOP|nr:unnamed protein product [Pieris macdunnoughi]